MDVISTNVVSESSYLSPHRAAMAPTEVWCEKCQHSRGKGTGVPGRDVG